MVQIKAQDELDRVVGRERLPDFSDQEDLPYISALIKEVLRWFPIIPLGVPHVNIIDDEYKGMHIPKGSVISPNVWAMVRDKEAYGSDSDLFRPERFLEGSLRDPSQIVFGFGRRICPGRYLALKSLFIAISSILHAFTIREAVDKDGGSIPIEARWISGITVHLSPFVCSIKSRFKGAEMLVKRETDVAGRDSQVPT